MRSTVEGRRMKEMVRISPPQGEAQEGEHLEDVCQELGPAPAGTPGVGSASGRLGPQRRDQTLGYGPS